MQQTCLFLHFVEMSGFFHADLHIISAINLFFIFLFCGTICDCVLTRAV